MSGESIVATGSFKESTRAKPVKADKPVKPRKKPGADLGPLVGRRHVRVISDYLATLRGLYSHPNRVLFYDDVVVAYLLAFFNPAVRSLRSIEDMSQVPGVNRFLSVDALCRSTLSDANALFDPEHLQGLISHVRSRLPRLEDQDPTLQKLVEQLVSFDGSFFKIAGDIQWALWHRNSNTDTRRHVRLNCMFCQATGVPLGVSLSGDDGTGEGAEAIKLLAALDSQEASASSGEEAEPLERIYLFDSGVVSFDLLARVLGRKEHFLCSLRKPVGFAYENPEQPELTPEDKTAGIDSDRIGRLKGSVGHRAPEGLLREIVVGYTDRHGKLQQLRLLTDLLELPACRIAELYRYRWQIELFFRWLKVHARFRHLMSFSRRGITSGFYIAILGAMLLCINSQQPLNKYALNLFGMVASGLADPKDILPILAKRAREKRLERERLARKKLLKKSL